MRIFLSWTDNYLESKYIVEELKKRSHKIVYWEKYLGGEKDKYSEYYLLGGIPPNIDISKYPPPGADLIGKLYKAESLVLTMMNKNYRYDKMCVDERRRLYYDILRYWYGKIRETDPNIIIYSSIPHAVYNYIIFEIARLLKIKTIMFQDTWVSDRVMVFNNFWNGNAEIKRAIEKDRNNNFQLDDLDDDIKKYYLWQKNPKADTTPCYILKKEERRIKRKKSWKKKLKPIRLAIKNREFFKKIYRYFTRPYRDNLKKDYEKLQTKPDLNNKFIYVPLNHQPEATSCPLGDMFVDQILMIEILSASLPSNWAIYVKEHPNQWNNRGVNFSSSRYKGYYEKIAKIKGVKIIPINISTYDLINKSQLIANVNGTAGWEAIMRNKAVMAFGYPWYIEAPGVFKVKDIKTCQEVINKVKFGFKISDQDVISYLKNFGEITIHGRIGVGEVVPTKLTDKENANNILNKILETIN